MASEKNELLDYLISLAESVGVDIGVNGLTNPKLALAARIQLKIADIEKRAEVCNLLDGEYLGSIYFNDDFLIKCADGVGYELIQSTDDPIGSSHLGCFDTLLEVLIALESARQYDWMVKDGDETESR